MSVIANYESLQITAAYRKLTHAGVVTLNVLPLANMELQEDLKDPSNILNHNIKEEFMFWDKV